MRTVGCGHEKFTQTLNQVLVNEPAKNQKGFCLSIFDDSLKHSICQKLRTDILIGFR